ncbi:DUF2878 domain-containing protein [Stenotrophomonas acidaminiphila]|uniref:DUF2878 domain-containing protein n=1 Tax=Stenotrophomonas TaxID=40323 RepID=UPI000CDCB059|nr:MULTISPECIES: DUF2878 domain-containing protein [Stenotrophomonas]AUZ54064.1 hypothetical protein B1L07_01740 [Stenotrophomonas acidaminiphila]MCH1909572.1 DUF2878 domain-containing protein [Stenotrophomonas sp. Y6]MPS34336.1 DUF2878 domain-containing protein [Stenotrophomonas sp.]WPU56351.1 DUF2878 domain-containing protein [Stenotrophomonas acidaminiphila]
MNTLAILLAYQATWFVAVIGAGRGSWWPGVLAAALFALWRLAVSPARALELRLLLAALGIGLLLESVWVGSGLLDYAAWPWAGPPAWILALWCAFALVVVPLLGYLHRRPWLAAALGAVGGPLAYLGAASGWDALRFSEPRWHALLALGAGWALAMPALAALAARGLQRDIPRGHTS